MKRNNFLKMLSGMILLAAFLFANTLSVYGASRTVAFQISPASGGTINYRLTGTAPWLEASTSGALDSTNDYDIKAIPAEGYQFVNWTASNNVTITTKTNASTAITSISSSTSTYVQANFEKVYKLTLSASSSSAGTVTGSGTYAGTKSVNISATANSGYKFVNWTGDTSGITDVTDNTISFTMGNADRNIAANFVKIYTVSVSATSGGTASGGGTYTAGGTVNITATANSGYKFVNWTGNTSGITDVTDSSVSFTIVNDLSITANFIKLYSLKVSVNPSSSGTVTGAGSYGSTEVASITATPSAGYLFTNWSGSTSGITDPTDSTASFTMGTSARTITANFSKAYTVTATSSPAAFGTVTGSGSYTSSATVTLNATPNAGCTFVGWSGSTSGLSSTTNPKVTFTMGSSNRIIYAIFKTQYTLAVNVPEGNGTVTGAGKYDSGTVVSVSATPDAGYVFTGWGGDATGTANPSSITMDKNKSITAHFAVKPELTYASHDVFTEAYANNGSVDTTINVTLSDAEFITGPFVEGTHFNTTNIPSNLSLAVKRISSNEVSLSLTGNAAANELKDSRDDIGITFTKAAFVNVSDASAIIGNNKNDIKLIFMNKASLSYESGAFTESENNDGSIAGTKSVYLEGAKFRNASDPSGKLAYGVDYTISNMSSIPQGLTLSAIRVSDHWVKLVLDGKASNHAARTISNIQINFLAAAFAEQSSTVANLTGNLQIKFIDKKPLRILEVYPSEIASGTSAVSVIEDTLGSNAQYDVTSMTMNKFISLKEDLNGKYDVLYFGKGRYFQNGVDDNKYGNDITNIAAQKVLEFINSNQLCIFHASAFQGDAVDGTKTSTPTTIMYKKLFSATTAGKDNVRVFDDAQSSAANIAANITSAYANENVDKRPILTVNDSPVSYESMSQPYETRSMYMKYTVYKQNVAASTTFSAILYVDRNNDSLFDPDEKVESQIVYNGGTNSIVFEMPGKLTGIFFWKLAVSDSNGAKDEHVDIFRLKGENIAVKVLQITPPNNNGDLVSLFNTSVTSGTAFDTIGYRYGEYNLIVTQATVDEFNAGTTKNLRNLNGNYDMVILGFHDNYADDTDALKKVFNQEAIDQLKSFIATKQGVMFTHDSIHTQLNANLTANFKDTVGQTDAYTAGLAGYTLSGARWTPPFTSAQETTINNNYAVSNYQKTAPAKATTVRNVNSTAMTLYPFNLETMSTDGPATIKVAATHFQWFKLNLEDPEVIPLFNLYTADSGDRINDDAMNNYYTYSKGNITYSGTGHSTGYPDSEVKLFVNTAMKAYSSANHAPYITLIEPKNGGNTSCSQTYFALSFKVFDFDYADTKVKYEVLIDLENDGTYAPVRSLTQVDNGEIINIPDVPNRTTPGAFKLRINAQDLKRAAADPVDITLYSTQAPLIDPHISLYDKDGASITTCLVGQKITVRTAMNVSGYADPEDVVTPQFSLGSSYTENGGTSSTTILTRANLPQVTFSSTAPSPGLLTTEAAVTADIGNSSSTTIDFNGYVEYTVNKTAAQPKPCGAQISVRDGKVGIHVTDEFGKNIKNAVVSDSSGTEVGTTDTEGWVRLKHIIGQKSYSIATPTGYVFSGTVQVYIHNYDVNGNDQGREAVSGNTVNVTYDKYSWEVEFKVHSDITARFSYYQLKSDKSVAPLGDDTQNRELKVQKNAPVKILVKLSISPNAGTDLKHIFLTVTTKKDNVELTEASPYYAAISTTLTNVANLSAVTSESALQLVSTSSSIRLLAGDAAAAAAAAAVTGMNRVKAENDDENTSNTYNYADAAKDTNHDGLIDYYFVLEIQKAFNQKINIGSMVFINKNESYPPVPVNGVNVLSITELTAPPLR